MLSANIMRISVQTQDRKIYRKDLLASRLVQAKYQDLDVAIDFAPEGSCAQSLGLYRLLDEFCETYDYDPGRISIHTANLLEQHDRYRIVTEPSYWYEIDQIRHWLSEHAVDTGTSPSKHFGCFVSRTTWARLWLSAYLDKYHASRTVQTYHYDRTRENYNGNGHVGLDDLFQFGCDMIPDCAEFLMTCPRTIDLDFLRSFDTSGSPFQHANSYYPIQVPANLNLLHYYHDIFVDIVTEPNIMGSNFLVTEKLWRCIIARRPFVVLGPGDYLHNLRQLGFETFYHYWNEDYDGQTCQTRIQHMTELVDEIAQWPISQCHEALTEMQPILDHNYQTFMNLDIARFNQPGLTHESTR